LLTTTQASRRAGVAPSTIKRWADRGLLPSRRTVGGHRRFDARDLADFLEQQERGRGAGQREAEWLQVLARGDRYLAEAALLQARSRLGAWSLVADELGGVLRAMGARWTRGEFSVAQEHLVSDTLTRALRRVGDGLPVAPAAPGCVLAGVPADDHALGLSLVELCLREVGWSSIWLGPATPSAALPEVLCRPHVRALALSASAVSSSVADLSALVDEVGAWCREGGVDLLLGGGGSWPEAPTHGIRLRSCTELATWLRQEVGG